MSPPSQTLLMYRRYFRAPGKVQKVAAPAGKSRPKQKFRATDRGLANPAFVVHGVHWLASTDRFGDIRTQSSFISTSGYSALSITGVLADRDNPATEGVVSGIASALLMAFEWAFWPPSKMAGSVRVASMHVLTWCSCWCAGGPAVNWKEIRLCFYDDHGVSLAEFPDHANSTTTS